MRECVIYSTVASTHQLLRSDNPPYLSILIYTYLGLATKPKRDFSGNI
jgi:hypothetical protein